MDNLFDEATIYHESGHAMVCAALGGTVDRAACLRNGDLLDGCQGFVDCHGLSDPIDKAAMLFGGVVGAAWGMGRDYGLMPRETVQAYKRTQKKRPPPQEGLSTYAPIRTKSNQQIQGCGSMDYALACKLLKGRPDADFETAQKTAMCCIALNLPILHELATALKAKMGLLKGANLQSILFRVVRPTAEQIARI
jgi:hypothetical protein